MFDMLSNTISQNLAHVVILVFVFVVMAWLFVIRQLRAAEVRAYKRRLVAKTFFPFVIILFVTLAWAYQIKITEKDRLGLMVEQVCKNQLHCQNVLNKKFDSCFEGNWSNKCYLNLSFSAKNIFHPLGCEVKSGPMIQCLVSEMQSFSSNTN